MTSTAQRFYTAKAHTTGGREGGASRTDDGRLDVKISPPGSAAQSSSASSSPATWCASSPTVFPGEIYRTPKSWAEKAYHKLIYFNVVDKGGHFAAWEQPELFASELRAAFKTLR
jgi:pimeloyl-ACP methyl ester carboxylesterase